MHQKLKNRRFLRHFGYLCVPDFLYKEEKAWAPNTSSVAWSRSLRIGFLAGGLRGPCHLRHHNQSKSFRDVLGNHSLAGDMDNKEIVKSGFMTPIFQTKFLYLSKCKMCFYCFQEINVLCLASFLINQKDRNKRKHGSTVGGLSQSTLSLIS